MVHKALIVWVAVAIMLSAGSAAFADTNVAWNHPVTLVGTFGSDPSLVPTVDDGAFLSEGTQWQNGTVWWNGTGPQVKINLGMDYVIDKFRVQADNNDTYAVYAYDGVTLVGTATFSTYGGAGMRTRPDYDIAAITCDNLIFQATGGDDM